MQFWSKIHLHLQHLQHEKVPVANSNIVLTLVPWLLQCKPDIFLFFVKFIKEEERKWQEKSLSIENAILINDSFTFLMFAMWKGNWEQHWQCTYLGSLVVAAQTGYFSIIFCSINQGICWEIIALIFRCIFAAFLQRFCSVFAASLCQCECPLSLSGSKLSTLKLIQQISLFYIVSSDQSKRKKKIIIILCRKWC